MSFFFNIATQPSISDGGGGETDLVTPIFGTIIPTGSALYVPVSNYLSLDGDGVVVNAATTTPADFVDGPGTNVTYAVSHATLASQSGYLYLLGLSCCGTTYFIKAACYDQDHAGSPDYATSQETNFGGIVFGQGTTTF